MAQIAMVVSDGMPVRGNQKLTSLVSSIKCHKLLL